MTIAVIWQEDGFQWCAADTLLTFEPDDRPRTEIAAKIFAIPISVRALDPDGELRQPHQWTQYGFVYSGATLTASLTAVTASTLLQQLVRPGDHANPPTFEQVSEVVTRLARRFMVDRGRFGQNDDGLFEAALFGWCPFTNAYKVAEIKGVNDSSGFRVDLSYPVAPPNDGDPWVLLGSGAAIFSSTLAAYRGSEKYITKRIPRRVVEKMVAEQLDPTVGGSTSIGLAHQHGFELCYAVEPIERGKPAARRVFNGLDLDEEVGMVGEYHIGAIGMA